MWFKTISNLRDKIRQRDKFINKLFDEKFDLLQEVEDLKLENANLRDALKVLTNYKKVEENKKKISPKSKRN